MCERPAAGFCANEIDAAELTQDAHVVADVAHGLAERLGELLRAGLASLLKALQNPHAQALGERLREPLI
jgi:hypothetical protein